MNPDVSPAQTRVLLALVIVHRRDGRATVRTVAERANLSAGTTFATLLRLRVKGLVAWERGRSGTLRPLVAEVVRCEADYWAAEQ